MSGRSRVRWRVGLGVACAVWLTSGLTVAAVPPRVAVVMLDDFDGEPNSLNQFFGARALLNSGCGDQLSVVASTFAGNALKLFYNHTTCDSGWTTRLDGQQAYRGRDLSDAVRLSFRVRGVVSTTRFRVRLTDALGAFATADITGVSSVWSEKTVDLTTAFPGVDRTQLSELAFILPRTYSDDADKIGTLYFDDIYFETDAPEPADDAALLEHMAYRCFRFFWDLANPTTGFAPDRATSEAVASIAGIGYQLGALPIGVEHGWVTREAAAARALLVLQTLATKPQRPAGSVPNENAYCGYHGFYYHMLNSTTGLRDATSELSSIDSTLLYLGVINALMYFDGPSADETNARAYASFILDRVDWPYLYDAGLKQIWMEWKPETGFGGHWDVYTDEAITMTLLAAASTTHPVPLDVYYGWRREQRHYTSYATYASWTGTQFTYYQAQNWLDLTDRTDRATKTPVNWLRNSWAATRGERQFAIDKSGTYSTYGPDAWGISDSSVPGASYYTPLAQPRLNGDADNDNGTIPCAAAGATLTFFYGDPDGNLARSALRHYFEDFDDVAGLPRLWRLYGLVDAYNTSGSSFWYSNEFICLGQGALLLSIENYLTGNAVGQRTGAYAPLAATMDLVYWPAGDVHDLIYAREAEQWDAHSAGGGMVNEYHPEASSNYTLQLGTTAGNYVTYSVKNFWEAGRNYRLEMRYSEDVPGNIVAVEWDGVEIGRFTTQDSGNWTTFITSPSLAIGPVGPGEHTLRIVNTNGGTYGVNLDVIRVYAYGRGDIDRNGTVNLADYSLFASCMTGPNNSTLPPGCTVAQFDGCDLDGDDDVDVADFGLFARALAE